MAVRWRSTATRSSSPGCRASSPGPSTPGAWWPVGRTSLPHPLPPSAIWLCATQVRKITTERNPAGSACGVLLASGARGRIRGTGEVCIWCVFSAYRPASAPRFGDDVGQHGSQLRGPSEALHRSPPHWLRRRSAPKWGQDGAAHTKALGGDADEATTGDHVPCEGVQTPAM